MQNQPVDLGATTLVFCFLRSLAPSGVIEVDKKTEMLNKIFKLDNDIFECNSTTIAIWVSLIVTGIRI